MDPTDTALPERERLVKQYREQISQYKSVNAELADLEWTLADVERQIGDLRAATGAFDSPAATQRLTDLERWKSALEEQILQRLYRAEALAAAVAKLREELRDLVAE